MNRSELKTSRDKQFNAGNYWNIQISGKHFNFPENISRKVLQNEIYETLQISLDEIFSQKTLRLSIFRILKWTKSERLQLDRKMRKFITKVRFHHTKPNKHQLHILREDRGRGIKSLVLGISCSLGAALCSKIRFTLPAIYTKNSNF